MCSTKFKMFLVANEWYFSRLHYGSLLRHTHKRDFYCHIRIVKSLVDETNNIHPRDLLRTFLEYSEINNLLKNEIIKANQKIQNTQNVELQNPLQAVDLPQEIKESQNNVESPSQEEATSVQSNNLNAQSN